jgi:hypothetical protein
MSWAKIISFLVAIGILIGGCIYLYNSGKNAGIGIANDRISAYEEKVQSLNAQLAQKEIIVRERVINNYHTRTIVRTKVEYKNQEVIRTVVPEQYKLSKGWVYAHDQSALGKEIDPALAANPDPSNVSDRTALVTIDENNNRANRVADRLEALQQYIREMGFPITNDPQTTNRPN